MQRDAQGGPLHEPDDQDREPTRTMPITTARRCRRTTRAWRRGAPGEGTLGPPDGEAPRPAAPADRTGGARALRRRQPRRRAGRACSASLVEHDIAPELVLGLLDRRPQRRRLRPGPHARRGRPPRGAVARARRRRASCRRAGSRTPWRWPGKGEAIHTNDRLRGLLSGLLRVDTFEELAVPFQCVATDVAGVREAWFSTGPLVEPILASAALPGRPARRWRSTASATSTAPSSTTCRSAGPSSWARRTIYVLHCGTVDRPRPEPKRPLDVAVQAYWVARHHRFKRDLETLPERRRGDRAAHRRRPGPLRFNDFTQSARDDRRRLRRHRPVPRRRRRRPRARCRPATARPEPASKDVR